MQSHSIISFYFICPLVFNKQLYTLIKEYIQNNYLFQFYICLNTVVFLSIEDIVFMWLTNFVFVFTFINTHTNALNGKFKKIFLKCMIYLIFLIKKFIYQNALFL